MVHNPGGQNTLRRHSIAIALLLGLGLFGISLQSAATGANLNFTCVAPEPGKSRELRIDVNGPSGEIDEQLVVNFHLLGEILSKSLSRTSEDGDALRVLLSAQKGIALSSKGGAQGWTLWHSAANDSDGVALIQLRNDLKPTISGNELLDPDSRGKLLAGKPLTIRIPLVATRLPESPVNVEYGSDVDEMGGLVEVCRFSEPHQSGDPTGRAQAPMPRAELALIPLQKKPRALGEQLQLKYAVERATYVVLRGPLPGGHTERELLPQRGADEPKNVVGEVNLLAIRNASYILEAMVVREGADIEERVVRSVNVQMDGLGTYADMIVRPSAVLPGGEVSVDWAVGQQRSDSKAADMRLIWTGANGERQARRLPISSASTSGSMCIIAPSNTSTTLHSVKLAEGAQIIERSYEVWSWAQQKELKFDVQGDAPVGLVALRDKLVLATRKKIRFSEAPDAAAGSYAWKEAAGTEGTGHWLALAAIKSRSEGDQEGAVALRRDSNGRLALVQFKFRAGGLEKTGDVIDLPDRFEQGPEYQMAAAKDRIYVISMQCRSEQGVRSSTESCQESDKRTVQKAISINLSSAYRGSEKFTEEALLSNPFLAGHWSVISTKEAIFALSRNEITDKGELFLFRPGEPGMFGTLGFPSRAAATATVTDEDPQGDGRIPLSKEGRLSLTRRGVPVDVGGVLVLLGSGEGQKYQPAVGKVNLINKARNSANCPVVETPQDLAYNLQTNRWTRSGHGLSLSLGSVAAYRDSEYPRLWAANKQGEVSSVSVESPRLFAADYFDGQQASLTDALGKTITFKLSFESDDLGESLLWAWLRPEFPAAIIGGKQSDTFSPALACPTKETCSPTYRVPIGRSNKLEVTYRDNTPLSIAVYGAAIGADLKPASAVELIELEYTPNAPSSSWRVQPLSASHDNYKITSERIVSGAGAINIVVKKIPRTGFAAKAAQSIH